MKPFFDVIIPTWNNLKQLKACLSSFLWQQQAPSYRLLVCVDGSTDGTLQYLEGLERQIPFLKILIHSDGKHHGVTFTRNLALAHVTAPYVVFFDSDLIATPYLLYHYYNFFQRHPKKVALGHVYYGNAIENLWAAYLNWRRQRIALYEKEVPYYYFTTGNSALPAHYFIALKGFCTALSGYGGTDAEFAMRLHKHFHPEFYILPQALAIGVMTKTLEQALKQRRFMGKTNLFTIAQKHPQEKNYFHLQLIKHQGITGKLSPLLFNSLIAKAAYRLLQFPLPYKIQLLLVRYLSAYELYQGFWEASIQFKRRNRSFF